VTWAKNFGDRYAGAPGTAADQKAKKVEKFCASCGTGVDSRKTYCGPCYDVRLQANIAKNRGKYRK
jgi:hypothetical protein